MGYYYQQPQIVYVQRQQVTVEQQMAAQQQAAGEIRASLHRLGAIEAELAQQFGSQSSPQVLETVDTLRVRLAQSERAMQSGVLSQTEKTSIESQRVEAVGLADQLEQALRASRTCLDHLEAPSVAMRLELGSERVAELLRASRQTMDQVLNAQTDVERAESVRQLVEISQEVGAAVGRLAQQADPLSEQNRQLDARLFAQNVPLPTARAAQGQVPSPSIVYRVEGTIHSSSQYAALPAGPAFIISSGASGGRALPPPCRAPMDVHIYIERDGLGGYRGDIWTKERAEARKFGINLSQPQVIEWSEKLRQVVSPVQTKYGTGLAYKESELQTNLVNLAEAGQAALAAMFDKETRDLIVESLEQKRDVRKHFTRVQISAEDFFLPWEMLYLEPGAGERTERGFWGFRYDICRTVLGDTQPITKSVLIADSRPDIFLLSLKEPAKQQVDLLEELKTAGKIHLYRVPPLNPQRVEQGLGTLHEFFQRNTHVVHVGSHASRATKKGSSQQSAFLEIDDEFPLWLSDLTEREYTLSGEPLVFLNACDTGGDPRSIKDFVQVFLDELGACGVIATEYRVPTGFAAEFAREFYADFLSGKTVGESLLAARHHFLAERHNPLGLLYSAYVELETRIDLQEPADKEE